MRVLSRIFLGLGLFLLVASAAYAWHAQEYEGVFLSLSVMIGAVLVGASVTVMVRRALAQIVADAAPPGTAADDEPHVKPTIWPLVFAVSSVALVVGIVANRWALIVGGAFFVAAAAGWIVDVRHQWHHHAHTSAAAAGHVPSQGGAHDGTDV